LERLRKNQARWQENLAADLAKKEALAQELTRLPELATRLEGKSREVDELWGKEARARQVLGAAKQRLDYCMYLAKEKEKKLKERRQVAEVEAINSIREDFERILVITHIEELMDAFPVRIDVFKTPQGSQVAIN